MKQVEWYVEWAGVRKATKDYKEYTIQENGYDGETVKVFGRRLASEEDANRFAQHLQSLGAHPRIRQVTMYDYE